MKPCKCGGRDITVTVLVVDRVRIEDDGELEFIDIGQPGDAGEWSRDALVACLRCGRVLRPSPRESGVGRLDNL